MLNCSLSVLFIFAINPLGALKITLFAKGDNSNVLPIDHVPDVQNKNCLAE